MAFPTDSESLVTLDAFIPEVWGEKINDFYKSKLIIAEFFTGRSSELSAGGATLYTPNMTEFTATEKANATAVNRVAALIIRLKQGIMNVYEKEIHSQNTLSFVQ